MSIYALIIALLFGSEAHCQFGSVTLFEDMSFRLLEGDNVQTCFSDFTAIQIYHRAFVPDNGYWYIGTTFAWDEIRLDGNVVTVTSYSYTSGNPFPESIQPETLRYDLRWLQYPK